MRKTITTVFTALLLFYCGIAGAFNVYRAGPIVKGKEYNDLLKRWIEKDFTVWVGINDNGLEWIFFEAETGLSPATIQVEYNDKFKTSTMAAINKAIKWSVVARKNQADTQKSLGCWGYGTTDSCDETGQARAEGEMGWQFFSTNKGKQTNLIVNIIDRKNQFYKAELYFSETQMKQIRHALTQIPARMKHAREQKKKQDLFK